MSATKTISPEDRSVVDTIARVGLLVLVLGNATAGWTDSDIWGHMSIGLDMLRDHRFLWSDPYSFTHDQLWVNHEWLWDLLIAATFSSGGVPGLIIARLSLIGIVVWVVDRSTVGLPGRVRILTLCLLAVGCAGQWRSTRPQIATMALYAVLLANLDRWWLPLLFLLWANVHGGWVFGLGAVVTYAVAHPTRRRLGVAAGCAAATLVNPYGARLWIAIAEAATRGWADVSEWQPIWRLSAGLDEVVVWLLLALVVVVLWRRVSHDPWSWFWSTVALAAAANSRRLIALAAITCAMLLIPRWRVSSQPVVVSWTPMRQSSLVCTIALTAMASVFWIRPSLQCFPPLAEWMAPEPDAVAFLRTTQVRRIVPHFDFGEYAIFNLRDRMQVAIDNRRETVYSADAVQANQRFTDGLDGDYPDRIGADAVWWPSSGLAVLHGLEQRGWVRRFEGPRTIVLMKSAGPIVRGRDTLGTPCFPQP